MTEEKYKFKTIIQDYGIFKFAVTCISKDSKFHFDISELSDLDIDRILKEINIQNIELKSVSPLSGGIAVLENGIPVIEPTCCNDLQSINEWEAILNSDKNRWRQLWIGHPWIYYKVIGDFVHFSDYTESGKEEYMEGEQCNIEKIREISLIELKSQLKIMRSELNDFQSKLKFKLQSIGIETESRYVNELIGKEE